MTEPHDDSGTPWIPDPVEREAFRNDLDAALAADAKLKPKRLVSYNQDAVLCPACQKRIRLNNNGRIRIHISGKVGSDKCMASDTLPMRTPIQPDSVVNASAEPKLAAPGSIFSKDDQPSIFSDQ